MLTKGTFYAYAGPLLLWFFLPRLWTAGPIRTLGHGMMVAAVAISLNTGFWIRNLDTYGGLFGAPGTLRGPLAIDDVLSREAFSTGATQERGEAKGQLDDLEEGRTPTLGGEPDSRRPTLPFMEIVGARAEWFLQRLARNIAQNTVMPTSLITSRSWSLLEKMPGLFDEEFLKSLREGMWNHEDTAGNLFHLLAALGSFAALALLSIRGREWRLPAMYGLVAFAGFSMLTLISYSVRLFGIRYQLPFFVMSAPAVGALFRPDRKDRWGLILAMGFLLSAWPYATLNYTRPLIGWRPKTRIDSVLTSSQEDILFAMAVGVEDEYVAVAKDVRTLGCRRVALDIGFNSLEYYWWWLLEAPQSGVRVETLRPVIETQGLAEKGFRPCAIICTHCGAVDKMEGYILLDDFGHVRLYRQALLAPSP